MTAPITDLTTLASRLRGLAAAHAPIVLDSSLLAPDVVGRIATAFALPDGAGLSVHGVAEADVPDPSDNQLTISTGAASLLKLIDVPVGLTFSMDGGALEVTVAATMPAGWAFAHSFAGLDLFPFTALTFTGASFVFCSVEQPSYPWPGDPKTTIDLAPGQNFLSEVGLGGVSTIATLLGDIIGKDGLRIYGPFNPTAGQQLPVGTLAVHLGGGTFSIGSAPFALSLADPRVAVRIGTADGATNPIQDVDLLVLGDFQQTLEVAVAIPVTDNRYTVSTTPLPSHSSVTSLIEALPGGAGFTEYIPAELSSIFSEVGLDNFSLVVDSKPSVTYLGLAISTTQSWPVIPDVLVLDGLTLVIELLDPSGLNWTRVLIDAKTTFLPQTNIFPGEFDFTIDLEKQTSWVVSTVSGRYFGAVNLGDLVAGLLGSHDSVPEALRDISFANFGVVATRAAPSDPFSYTCYGSVEVAFPILGTQLSSQLDVVFSKTPTGYAVELSGTLVIGQEAFALTLDLGTAGALLSATWTSLGSPLEFGDIATALGFADVPPIPASLDLQLVSATFSYDFAGTLVLTAQTKNPYYGSAAFVARSGQYFFGMRIAETINLTADLPLLKSVLSADETVALQNLQAAIASAQLDPTAATAINDLLKGEGLPQVPGMGLPAGVALAMDFQAGGYTQALTISTGDTDGQAAGGGGGAVAGVGGATPPATTGQGSDNSVSSSKSPDGTVWYNLQKKFGPVTFQKVGIRYQKSADGKDGILYALMNAGLDAGGLSIAVLGLGVGSPLTSFQPHFTIDGLAVTLAEGPVEVSGGLMGTIDPTVNFYGEIVLGFTELTISALGGYAEYQGHPSFFLYAVLDYPLGGPPFFFVTGIAAGLGFNRTLLIPDITGVTTFPLVAWARGMGAPPMDPGGDVGAQVTQVVGTLVASGVVAPALGSYWLALGVRFTSFQIIDAFALLTVTFGTRFEIDILGVATLSIPPEATPPIARVELALKASFAPDRGLLSVEGQLTGNSYVLDQAAHLTGGFAFYSWFAGEHEGDFVVSLGGYNAAFTVPTHYPKVPRLGLNWQVLPDGSLTIQGELYFALTSNAVMAGGKLSAVWSSGPISAWFTVWADFLMIFKPFHYLIGAGIDLGASFSIKVLFVHIRLTIHVGVDLQIWGPPFAGVARVHLYIISFDIRFGNGDPSQDTTLPWPDFIKQMQPSAPAPKPSPQPPRFRRTIAGAAQQGDTSAAQPAVVQVSVTQGLVKTLDSTPAYPWYLVNGETFQCQVTTTIPFKSATWKGIVSQAPDDQQPHDEQGALIQPNTSFSAGIAGISADDFKPAMAIEVDSTEDSTLYGVRVFRNAPKAFWETKQFTNGVPQIDPSTGLTSTTIPNALSGFVLIPEPPTPDHTLEIPLPVLESTLEDVQPFAWSAPTYATTDDFTDQTVASTIADTNVAEKVRDPILAAMAGQGITIDSAIAVASLANPANNDLMAAPTLSLLGEQRTNGAAAREAV